MNKILILLVAVFLAAAVQSENRIWTGKAGQTIEAEYVKDASGKVWLRPVSGKVKVVPIAALSTEDQNYIYKQTLPKIEISVDDDIKRSTVGSDIDNVHEKIKFEVQVKKTSKDPYPVDYEIIFCALGEDIRYDELILADKKVETFSLKERNDVYSFTGQELHFEHDPDPAWGTRYDGYLVRVQTVEGVVLATKGKSKYIEGVNVLRDAQVRSRFDKNFNVSTRSSNRF